MRKKTVSLILALVLSAGLLPALPAIQALAAEAPDAAGETQGTLVPADSPGIVDAAWIKSYGGTFEDFFYSVVQATDGGYVAVGHSWSGDSDLSGNEGSDDFVIAKFDISGNKVWTKTYGGTDFDEFYSVVQTADGGYVAVGCSQSSDGDLPVSTGGTEFVIAKFDASGGKVWVRNYGGAYSDALRSVIQTADGGYVAVGCSYANYGDLPGNKGVSDFVIAKFDADGIKVWIRSYGGTSEDRFTSVVQTADGGYVAVGYSSSSDGDLPGNKGDVGDDFVIAKFDADGNKVWAKNYGGTSDDFFYSVAPAADGGYVAVGYSSSSDGDLPGNKGGSDFVIAKFDADGGKVWVRSYGGTSEDRFYSVAPAADGGYVAVGYSYSSDGDLPGNKGGYDFVIAKFDASGSTDPGPATDPTRPDRNAGLGRNQTAALASQRAYPNPAAVSTVIISRDDNFPDALAASYLAGAANASMLLTPTGSLHEATEAELVRLAPSKVYVLGGKESVSDAVIDAIRALPSAPDVQRLGGTNRFATSILIADEAKALAGTPATAFVVAAEQFPDAVSAAAFAASQRVPVLLTNKDSLADASAQFIRDNAIKDVVILGGEVAVSEGVRAQIEALGTGVTAVRWGGADRYDTSRVVAQSAIAKWGIAPTILGVATGEKYPDALVGGALVGNRGGILVLCSPHALSPSVTTVATLGRPSITAVEIFGGDNSVPDAYDGQIGALFK